LKKVEIQLNNVSGRKYFLKIIAAKSQSGLISVSIDYGCPVFRQFQAGGRKLFLFVEKFDHPEFLEKEFSWNSGTYQNCLNKVGGRYVLLIVDPEQIAIQIDRLGRTDLFYSSSSDRYIISSDLTSHELGGRSDDLSLVYFFSIYGSRAPRNRTVVDSVRRLGCDQYLVCSKEILSKRIEAKYLKGIGRKGVYSQEQYNKRLLEILEHRGDKKLNVVYLSSGWDSTSICAGLVHVFGRKNVIAVTSRATNSTETGHHNEFEISRAERVAEHLGIEHRIIDSDYSLDCYRDISDRLAFTKKFGLYGPTAMSIHQISRYVRTEFGAGANAFHGEYSDGVHNLGFSQYVSAFHKYSRDFREYFDKMRSYLYGPTFLSAMKSAEYSDSAYETIIRGLQDQHLYSFEPRSEPVINELLKSFFLTPTRVPYLRKSNPILTERAREAFFEKMFSEYLEPYAENYDEECHYLSFMRAYASFHWQSSNVACIELAGSENNITNHIPFQDLQFIDYMAGAPEHWGRGLELKPTKYPLKRFLSEKLEFPEEISLGPHSYIYDVIPSFSILGEYVCSSGLTNHFKEYLRSGPKISLKEEFFDLAYVARITDQYLRGEKLYSQDLENVSKIIELAFHRPEEGVM